MASTTPTAAVSRSLAIAAHIPSREIGSGYFQETHPEHLFRDCSHYCELVSQPEQMPRVLEIAIQTARARRGVAVVVLPAISRCEGPWTSNRVSGFGNPGRVFVPPTRSSPRWPVF